MSAGGRTTVVILDGFGLSPARQGNAIYQAKTPELDRILGQYPYTALQAHGIEVGLNWGQMGNSEVGHMNLGAGRVVLQAATKITAAVGDQSFFHNQALIGACQAARTQRLHLIGLISNGGIHGHVAQYQALLDLAHQHNVQSISLHLISDGRDAEPTSFLKFYQDLQMDIHRSGAQVATLMGRYYAMDRDRRWDRTQAAYEAMVDGRGPSAASIEEAVAQAYASEPRGDEFIAPTVLSPDDPSLRISPGDVVIMTNYRADRARQLAAALAQNDFPGFTRQVQNLSFTSFTDYGVPLDQATVAFQPDAVPQPLSEILGQADLRQMHIAETEKYAHVTYFFNGGQERSVPGEKRVLINSPKVTTYDTCPSMSTVQITDQLLEAYRSQAFDVAIINFANPDMVGHTGNLGATVKAIEAVDTQLGRILTVVEEAGDVLVITADHGNAEQLIHPETGQIDKEHTANPVPFIVVAPHLKRRGKAKDAKLQLMSASAIGMLADVAPTVLDLLGLDVPDVMTGRSLMQTLAYAQADSEPSVVRRTKSH